MAFNSILEARTVRSIWRQTAFYLVAILSVFILCGCATPHRDSQSTHSIKRYQGRQDGMIASEEWRDEHRAGAIFFFTDPSSQGFCDKFTNQPGLGGSSWFMAAPFSMIVDSNLVPAISATGTAMGNVIGAAAKSAVK